MKCYQVQTNGKTLKWASSMADCRAAKKELVDGGIAKAKEIEYVETEVPTSKSELLEFLNENCVFTDNEE